MSIKKYIPPELEQIKIQQDIMVMSNDSVITDGGIDEDDRWGGLVTPS